MGEVVVVASVNVDMVATVDHLPGPGETVTGGTFARHHGGKGANQAVAATRWGAHVHVLGAVGDDELGEDALAALADEGIDTRHVRHVRDTPTGVALITVDEHGDNQIAVASGANHHVDAGGLEDLLASRPAPGVLLTGFEVPDAAVARTLQAARGTAWTVVVDPAPARDLATALDGSGAVLTPNRGELAALVGDGPPEQAARRLVEEVTGAPVVVTLGADGALVVTADDATAIPAPAVHPRDTTGAGDTFAGVLAAGLADGQPLVHAVQAAVAASTRSTASPGARTGMPTRAQVDTDAPGTR